MCYLIELTIHFERRYTLNVDLSDIGLRILVCVRYGEGNVMYATYQTYANLLLRADQPPKLPLLPELFATASEFEATLAAQPQVI
jgi:hypothetical protein